MSKGNVLQGQASGKLGDTVLMVRNGQQIARVYTKAGARSGDNASEAARIQRVKFGGASNQWSLYKYVCTRMFRKGRKTNQSDYNYFVKRNNLLFPYLSKQENQDGVHVLQPGQFSEGNLGRIDLLHVVTPQATLNNYFLYVSDLNAPRVGNIFWDSTVGALKDALKLCYPSARKVTFLLSMPSSFNISEEDVVFTSQFVSHYPVIFDLYSETTTGENAEEVSDFVSERVSDTVVKQTIGLMKHNQFMWHGSFFYFTNVEGVDMNYMQNLAVLVFATDDNASDCYTTILQDTSIPSAFGPYAVWAGYRTQNSLRIAADSYGYQSGVMRDEIASIGDDLTEQMQQYVSKVRSLDKDAAVSIEKHVKSAGATATVVRSVVATDEKSK